MPEHRTTGPRPAPDAELLDRLPPDIAERTAQRLERETGSDTRLGDPRDQVRALEHEVRNEADGMAAGVGLGFATESQVRGSLFWAVLGTLVGAAVGALIGLIPMADLTLGTREVIWVIVGALAGASAGFVFGGGRQPEIEGDVRDSSNELAITVHPHGQDDADRAERILSEADVEAAERARKLAKVDEHHAFDPLDDQRPPTS